MNGVDNEFNRLLLRSLCMSSYCAQRTKILTSEGHVFDQELAFGLLGVPFPIFSTVLRPTEFALKQPIKCTKRIIPREYSLLQMNIMMKDHIFELRRKT